MRAAVCAVGLGLLAFGSSAAPLPPSSVPAPLAPWVPWVLYGSEQLACPTPYSQPDTHTCVWPSALELQADAQGASFKFEVQVYGAPAVVPLPGSAEAWPQDVRDGAAPLAVVLREARPSVQLPAGRHVLTGRIAWTELPPDVLLPQALGSLRFTLDGQPANRWPDAEGRLWLRQADTQTPQGDAVSLRIARRVDDDIPLRLTTHLDLSVAGKPRELRLPAVLLPGFIAEGIATTLPARLNDDGSLSLQLRAGQWRVQLTGRSTKPLASLTLPAISGAGEETWSVATHNELRLVGIEGVPQIDPKQVPLPDDWRALPAYRLKPGDTMRFVESRRGNPDPGPDTLSIAREIWLDFSGQGYTVRDRISGKLSRSWRLDIAAPALLGRAAVQGADQPITRAVAGDGSGIEVRQGVADISADSRLESSTRHLSASGWRADFERAEATLNLPPGWRLLHAQGVDHAGGSWIGGWSLWDFFFVLIAAFAAGRLFGWRSGILLGAALVVSWHLEGAPGLLWLVLLAFIALLRVLPAGRLRSAARWGRGLSAAAIALVLLPFAVTQLRHSMYPTLEPQGAGMSLEATALSDAARPAPVVAPPPPAASPKIADALSQSYRSMDNSKSEVRSVAQAPAPPLDEIDPNAQVQTGPGVPAWHWHRHRLSWQGPVSAAQSIDLWLLPPAATAVWRIGSLLLLTAALLAVLGHWPAGWRKPPAAAGVVVCLTMSIMCGLAPTDAQAQSPQPPPQSPPQAPTPPMIDGAKPRDLLDELRQRLTAAPDCMPACAEVARLRVDAQGSRVQLRLQAHALADVMLPLPGQGTHWRARTVTVDGQPATLRRDEAGTLWIALRSGVAQVLLEGDVGSAATVEIALPMPVRALSSQLDGWALAGLDARGLPAGALSLSRASQGGAVARGDGSTQRDALPPFVRVERLLHLGLRWTLETRVVRIGPSLAPAQVRVRLLAGESVNDAAVRVVDGFALLSLGGEAEARFVSSVKESAKLTLQSTDEANQIERWQLDASTQWHVVPGGIAPVLHQVGERWMPVWQPWPGESVTLDIGKPAGVAGQTFTVDRLATTVTPGLRETQVSAEIGLRSSQGGNHRVELPAGAVPTGLVVDGQPQPVPVLRAPNRTVLVPITPGAHVVVLAWREPHGMGVWFEPSRLDVGAPGVNETLTLQVPEDRVVLWLGGPPVGPAVLFWGVLVALAGAAWALGRTRFTPLSALTWFLLGLGLAQASLLGATIVAGWFFVVAARGHRQPIASRFGFNALQLGVVAWTLVAAVVLLWTLHDGLLGHPDLIVTGNGSSAWQLRWYQDRLQGLSSRAWVVSVPVLVYRLAMLAWALWLARALLGWIRWAWQAWSGGGYWRGKPRVVVAAEEPVPAGE